MLKRLPKGSHFLFFSLLFLGLACQKSPNLQKDRSVSLSITSDIIENFVFPTFIINGEDVKIEDPFALSIVGVVNLEKGSMCTGTLINREHVLTAAHCLGNQIQNVRIFSGLSRGQMTSILDAVASVTTEEWKTRSQEDFDRGDLAIIRFTGDLPRQYKPIQLGTAESLNVGDEVLIAGYGRNDGVNKKGAGTLRKVNVNVANPTYGNTEVLFDQQQGRGACHGDSGGPAFKLIGKTYVQWGVTSREHEDPNKDCTHFSIYTKIEPYIDWIKANSNI